MPLKVNILHWHAVARWSWGDDVDGDVCAICQFPFEGCPPGVMYPGDGAPVVWGVCKHAFHLQCVSQWLQTKNTCCICRADWEFESNSASRADEHAAANPGALPAPAPAPAAAGENPDAGAEGNAG